MRDVNKKVIENLEKLGQVKDVVNRNLTKTFCLDLLYKAKIITHGQLKVGDAYRKLVRRVRFYICAPRIARYKYNEHTNPLIPLPDLTSERWEKEQQQLIKLWREVSIALFMLGKREKSIFEKVVLEDRMALMKNEAYVMVVKRGLQSIEKIFKGLKSAVSMQSAK